MRNLNVYIYIYIYIILCNKYTSGQNQNIRHDLNTHTLIATSKEMAKKRTNTRHNNLFAHKKHHRTFEEEVYQTIKVPILKQHHGMLQPQSSIIIFLDESKNEHFIHLEDFVHADIHVATYDHESISPVKQMVLTSHSLLSILGRAFAVGNDLLNNDCSQDGKKGETNKYNNCPLLIG